MGKQEKELEESMRINNVYFNPSQIKMKALDLFCCAGGSSRGLAEAGFEVVGVDITEQPEYPFKFIKADVTKLPVEFLKEFDFIWASPPCQLFTRAKHLRTAQGFKTIALNLIPETRELLLKTGLPFVIENVEGSPLKRDLMLCGSMFDLQVRRHRIFECSFKIEQPKCNHKKQARPIGVYHRMKDSIPHGGKTASNLEEAQNSMGLKLSWNKLKEAIPPKYAEYIGKCFIKFSENGIHTENQKE